MTEAIPEMSDNRNFSGSEYTYFKDLSSHFDESPGTTLQKLGAFPRYVPRQMLATFLARERIFQKIVGIHGHIIECGVFRGAGLFSWANLSSIFEPYNHTRRIVGFDTFTGFVEIGEKDQSESGPEYKVAGGLASDDFSSMLRSVSLFDLNRFIAQIPRIEMIQGDAIDTMPEYRRANPHLLVALLYLDFDLFEPTRVAIETFWPLMPKGSVIAFDELNQSQWPGETQALVKEIGIGTLTIQRFSFHPQISFAIKD